MVLPKVMNNSLPFPEKPIKICVLPKNLTSYPNPKAHLKPNRKISSTQKNILPTASANQKANTNPNGKTYNVKVSVPTMPEIMDASRLQNLDIQLQTIGPFFRITAKRLGTQRELGKAEGVIRVWFGGKVLHLDSMRLKRETIGMEKSIFGMGLFIGAVAIRHGYDCGCTRAELLAIYDTHLYHSKIFMTECQWICSKDNPFVHSHCPRVAYSWPKKSYFFKNVRIKEKPENLPSAMYLDNVVQKYNKARLAEKRCNFTYVTGKRTPIKVLPQVFTYYYD